MGGWKAWAAMLAAAAASGGCIGLPPALIVANYAAEAGAYVTTGRTLTDHAISGVAGEDCMVSRVIDGDDICHAWGEEELAVAERTEQPPVPDGAVVGSAGAVTAVATVPLEAPGPALGPALGPASGPAAGSDDPLAAYITPAPGQAAGLSTGPGIGAAPIAADELMFAQPAAPGFVGPVVAEAPAAEREGTPHPTAARPSVRPAPPMIETVYAVADGAMWPTPGRRPALPAR